MYDLCYAHVYGACTDVKKKREYNKTASPIVGFVTFSSSNRKEQNQSSFATQLLSLPFNVKDRSGDCLQQVRDRCSGRNFWLRSG